MTAIPNTKRRGAIYWYRRSRRLPCGSHNRPIVSLRTACPRAARRRAAMLTAKFEDLCMHLFGKPGRRFTLDREAATRIFQAEFNKALDAMDAESLQAGAWDPAGTSIMTACHTLESQTAGRYSKASRLNVLLDAVNKIPVVTGSLRATKICLVAN
ncbi:MAG: hypothetical protein ACK4K7_04965 [Allosphingosinicella sp.]|uniref:hypothetical protein n=1 Tax=Allosphingosinicella sp. TaxID=2823234 RepID=UPI003936C2D1